MSINSASILVILYLLQVEVLTSSVNDCRGVKYAYSAKGLDQSDVPRQPRQGKPDFCSKTHLLESFKFTLLLQSIFIIIKSQNRNIWFFLFENSISIAITGFMKSCK